LHHLVITVTATHRFVSVAATAPQASLLAEGAPLTAVAGHLGDTVSRTYAHWLRDDREVPASALDRILAPAAEVPLSADGVK